MEQSYVVVIVWLNLRFMMTQMIQKYFIGMPSCGAPARLRSSRLGQNMTMITIAEHIHLQF